MITLIIDSKELKTEFFVVDTHFPNKKDIANNRLTIKDKNEINEDKPTNGNSSLHSDCRY